MERSKDAGLIMCSDLPRDLGVLLLNHDSISDAALAAPVLGSTDDESAREDLKGKGGESRKGSESDQMEAALFVGD
jgi:hypothetical protein